MKNRAKCRLCEKIVESLLDNDYQQCICGEIAIDGGESSFKAYAKNWDNFLRIDENGNEKEVKIVDKFSEKKEEEKPLGTDCSEIRHSKEEIYQILDLMIKDIERLPDWEVRKPVSQYDLMTLMILLRDYFKS